MIVLFCGLSGAGKTTIACRVQLKLLEKNIKSEIIDGDEYRKVLCRDLGFSKNDRQENIRRLSFVASKFAGHGIVSLVSAINPYEDLRLEIKKQYANVKLVYIDCSLDTLMCRDTKGLYKKALLPDEHPDKIKNLTGINDTFDIPENPDLHLNTDLQTVSESAQELYDFILSAYL